MEKRSVKEILEMHRKWLVGNNGKKLRWYELSIEEKQMIKDTNLRGANLRDAYFECANLIGADLIGADLIGANLRGANLRGANLSDANLIGSNLVDADLRGANLSDANLRDAYLIGANLSDAKGLYINCPEFGSFIAFKKLRDGLIAKLEIPEHAKRSSAAGRKCRASEAKVLEIFNIDNQDIKHDEGYSKHKSDFKYEVGKTVIPDSFDKNRFNECGNGIHFFITLQEAIDY